MADRRPRGASGHRWRDIAVQQRSDIPCLRPDQGPTFMRRHGALTDQRDVLLSHPHSTYSVKLCLAPVQRSFQTIPCAPLVKFLADFCDGRIQGRTHIEPGAECGPKALRLCAS